MNVMNMRKDRKIIYAIPAGRRRYLKILFRYLSNDDFIDEIWIFYNCRDQKDREFIENFVEKKQREGEEKWKLIKIKNPDGTNKSVSRIYEYMVSFKEKAFFIKVDDDIVYMDENFSQKFYEKSLKYAKIY